MFSSSSSSTHYNTGRGGLSSSSSPSYNNFTSAAPSSSSASALNADTTPSITPPYTTPAESRFISKCLADTQAAMRDFNAIYSRCVVARTDLVTLGYSPTTANHQITRHMRGLLERIKEFEDATAFYLQQAMRHDRRGKSVQLAALARWERAGRERVEKAQKERYSRDS